MPIPHPPPPPPPSSSPHQLRITNHGKINTWVAFALDFFQVPSLPALSLARTLSRAEKPRQPTDLPHHAIRRGIASIAPRR